VDIINKHYSKETKETGINQMTVKKPTSTKEFICFCCGDRGYIAQNQETMGAIRK
jgi:hypothetical protein